MERRRTRGDNQDRNRELDHAELLLRELELDDVEELRPLQQIRCRKREPMSPLIVLIVSEEIGRDRW